MTHAVKIIMKNQNSKNKKKLLNMLLLIAKYDSPFKSSWNLIRLLFKNFCCDQDFDFWKKVSHVFRIIKCRIIFTWQGSFTFDISLNLQNFNLPASIAKKGVVDFDQKYKRIRIFPSWLTSYVIYILKH